MTRRVAVICAVLAGCGGEEREADEDVPGFGGGKADGELGFVVPFEEDPEPRSRQAETATELQRADVVFAMDTTGSMGSQIAQLQLGIGTIIGEVADVIPDAAFGVASYRDFDEGTPVVELDHRVMTIATAGGRASLDGRLAGLSAGGGGDEPEAGWEMVHQIATGAGLSNGHGSAAAFDPATAFPTSAPAGEQLGDGPGAGFRAGSQPILVWFTDASSHNSDGELGVGQEYFFTGAATRTQAIAEMQALGGRIIGVMSASAPATRADYRHAIAQTGAVIAPDAWDGARPPGCAVGKCCTSFGGAGEAPDADGSCPLLFQIGADGGGLSSSVAGAIQRMATATPQDVDAVLVDDPGDAVDTVSAFVERVETFDGGAGCATGLTTADGDGDGADDTYLAVPPGTTVCFRLVAARNTTVPPTEVDQRFPARLTVRGNRVATLAEYPTEFVVPASQVSECGNGVCVEGECDTCPGDCEPAECPGCGNGVCESATAECNTCPGDCEPNEC